QKPVQNLCRTDSSAGHGARGSLSRRAAPPPRAPPHSFTARAAFDNGFAPSARIQESLVAVSANVSVEPDLGPISLPDGLPGQGRPRAALKQCGSGFLA